MLVLILGDLHIPTRATDLPAKFKRLLVPGKIQSILCTGNVCDAETHEYLQSIAPEVHVVKGDCDESPYPLSLILPFPPSLRIGLLPSTPVTPSHPPANRPALEALARQMDVDVLVSGGTGKFGSWEAGGRFFVDPGSGTGAWNGGALGETPVPSFALMDIQGPQVVTYVYSLVAGEVKVEKIEYRKPIEDAGPAGSSSAAGAGGAAAVAAGVGGMGIRSASGGQAGGGEGW